MSKQDLKKFFPKNVKGLTDTISETPEEGSSPEPASEPAVKKETQATSQEDPNAAKTVETEGKEGEEVKTEPKEGEVEAEASETSDVDTEGSEPWFSDEELGIIYENDAEARRGLVEKEKYIRKLSSERDAYQKKLDELQTQLETQQTKQGRENSFEDRVRERLPEEFQNLEASEITDEEKLSKYLDSLATAKAEVIAEDRMAEVQQKTQLEQKKQRRDQAQKHVQSRVDNYLSSMKNVEDRMALEDALTEKTEVNGREITPALAAIMLATELRPEYADYFLDGLYTRYKDQKRQNVEKYIRETKVDRTPSTPAAPAPDRSKITGPKLRGTDALRFILKDKLQDV